MQEQLESLGVPWASKKGPWSREVFDAIDAALHRPLH
jgi:hypothetical protein